MTVFLILVSIVVVVGAALVMYWRTIKQVLPLESRADEVHTIKTKDGWTLSLLRYRPSNGDVGEPVFLCHGLSANHWNFALPQDVSLIDSLLAKGYDCWAIDLRGNRSCIPPAGVARSAATFDGFVLEDIPAALAHIREQTEYDQVHWVGHSMDGLLLYAYEVVHGRDALASGTTLGAPPGLKGVGVSHERAFLSVSRKSPWLAETIFRSMTPLVPTLKPRTSMLPINWDNVGDNTSAKLWFNLAELPQPNVAETLIDMAIYDYLGARENTVDILAGLRTLQTPLFVIHGVLDPLATVENVRTFFERLPSDDKRILELSKLKGASADYDHLDLVFGANCVEEIYAPIIEWISAHPMTSSGRSRAEGTPSTARTIDQVPQEAALSAPGGLWGGALKDAAEALSGLDEAGPEEFPVKKPVRRSALASAKPRASKRRRVVKKAAAKKATAKKPKAKKAGQKKKDKAKSKKKTVTKKAANTKVAKKKAGTKSKPAKKTVGKKKATAKKKAAKKKSAGKKSTAKKVVKKKARSKK